MNKVLYQSMFAFLSVLLLAVLFVIQPSDNPEMKAFRSELKNEFSVAAIQLLEGESVTEPFAFIWSSVSAFYDESATQAIALLNNDNIAQLALMFNSAYRADVEVASAPLIAKLVEPTEDALINIVPYNESENLIDPYFNEDLAYMPEGGKILGESIDVNEAPETIKPAPVVWTNLSDSITGEAYCVAIFNGTVNSYPGLCARDDVSVPIYEN